MGRILFQLAAWTSGILRFATVVGGMYGSIRLAPPEYSLELFLGSAFVLPGLLAGLNLVLFDLIRRWSYGDRYGSAKYRRSVRNSAIFAGLVGSALVYFVFQSH